MNTYETTRNSIHTEKGLCFMKSFKTEVHKHIARGQTIYVECVTPQLHENEINDARKKIEHQLFEVFSRYM